MLQAILLATLTGLSASATAVEDVIASDRPGFADGADVVGRSRIQVEAGIQRDTNRAGEDPERRTFLPTLLRAGLTEASEVRLESDLYAWMRHPEGPRSEAYAPMSFGFKYRFREAANGQPALAAIVRATPPSGSKTLRSHRTTGDVRIAADLELSEKWSVNPNVGFALEEDDEGRRFRTASIAGTLAYKPTRTLELFVDSAVKTPETKGRRSSLVSDGGIAYLLSRDVQVDMSIGRRGRGTTAPRSFLAAGMSVRF